MPQESPTRLIERETLADLVESSRGPRFAHTIRRGEEGERVRDPSALRGLLIVAVFAVLARALFRWFLY